LATIPSLAGRTFASRYAVERELGHGGTAIVYLARDLSHGRMVAIKTLRTDLTEAVSPERFLREIRLTAALHHPHIVPLLDSGEAEGALYCVMPYMDGGTLRDRLKVEKQLPLEEVVSIGRTIASALESAHEKGLIHRDVKPENILYTGGQPCLSDFGIARALVRGSSEESTTSTGIVRGTPAYMSPEQASGDEEYDGRSDIYSLACVLYEAIAGMQAFVGPTQQSVIAQRMVHPPRPLHIYRPAIPIAVERVIEKAMAVAPADRFQSAGDFARALEASSTSTETAAGVAGAQAPRASMRRRILAGFATVVAVAAIGLTVQKLGPSIGGKPTLNLSQLAVAPFDVIGAPSAEWRYGLVDVLARNFDGAGPIVSVPASFVIARWGPSARADRATAQRLAEQTGAGLVVFGQLVFHDSTRVQLRASIYDAVARRMIAEPDLSGTDPAKVFDLADSLTNITLDVLGKSRAIAAVNRPSLSWPNLEALKAYLRGEQHLRKNEYADALREYQLSIRADSSFALAYRGAHRSLRVLNSEADSTSLAYSLLAGARNHRLTTRDSLLIVADSLVASCGLRSMYDAVCHQRLGRQLEVLRSAALRYPNDPEVFEELGETRVHLGTFFGQTADAALSAFTRAIASDPGYAPPYFHATELAATFGGDSAAHIVDGYLRQNPNDTRYRLIAKALAAASRGRVLTGAELQGEKINDIGDAAYVLRRWPGKLHPSDALREFVFTSRGTDEATRQTANAWLFLNRLAHGQLHDARRVLLPTNAQRVPLDVAILALLDTVRTDSAATLLSTWPQNANIRTTLSVLPWWATARDTAALARAATRFRVLAAASGASEADRDAAQYGERAIAFYAALNAADSVGALREGRQLVEFSCASHCIPELLKVSALLRAAGKPDSAGALLDAHPPWLSVFGVVEVLWQFERATVASQRLAGPLIDIERGRELRAAGDNYLLVINAWCGADPLLQPVVSEARARLAKIANAPRPSC
jgi:serine/threonine-protein kinase